MKLKARFSKLGSMRFISHLDLCRLFQRASRRAGLPVAITQGFNPRLKISIERALKLGIVSDQEKIIFHLREAIDPELFKKDLNSKLPEGIQILAIEKDE